MCVGGRGGGVVKGVPPLQELKRVSGLHCTFAALQRDFFRCRVATLDRSKVGTVGKTFPISI